MKRIRRLFQDERADVERELAAHITLRAEQLLGEGRVASSEEALKLARQEFDLAAVSAECTTIRLARNRERKRRSLLDAIAQDVRFGWRTLLRSPAFSVTAILILGMGFGAVITVGTMVRAVLLRPLPYADDNALVRVTERNLESGERDRGMSVPLYEDIRASSRSFIDIGIVSGESFVNRERGAVRLQGAAMSPSMFATLGVAPLMGRPITDAEANSGAPVALIAEGLWREWFGARADILGQTIQLRGQPYTIIGVMPASFDFPAEDSRVWVGFRAEDFMRLRRVHVVSAVARLAPGVSQAAADQELHEIFRRGQLAEPGSDPGDEPYTASLRDGLIGPGRSALLLLFGAAGVVLLLAAANVSGLLIARGAARSSELATRLALGAGRFAVMRQLLVESVLIGLGGAALGLACATVGARALQRLAIARVPGLDIVRIDATAILLTIAFTMITAVLFGLVPAWRATRWRTVGVGALSSSRTTAGRPSQRLRRSLVVLQTAMAITLVYSASVLIRSFLRLQSQDPGIRAENVVVMSISPSVERVKDAAGVVAYYRTLPSRIEAIPGVRSASATNVLPISGGDSHGELTIEGQQFPPGQAPAASYRRILPNYFSTIGMRLVAGREFEPGDGERDPKVVIIGEGMARRHFGSAAAALNQRIKVGPQESEPWLTIVGVVNDVRNESLETIDEYATYEPHPQRPWQQMFLAVRAQAAPGALVPAIRAELLRDDPAILIEDVTTMGDQIRASIAPRRLTSNLVAALGIIAMMLAAIGIYGLIASSVIDRRRELAVRAALGAAHTGLMRLVLSEAAVLGLAGIALGIIGASLTGVVLRALLYGSNGREPIALAVAALALLLTTVLASAIPALRAARVSPAQALRS